MKDVYVLMRNVDGLETFYYEHEGKSPQASIDITFDTEAAARTVAESQLRQKPALGEIVVVKLTVVARCEHKLIWT